MNSRLAITAVYSPMPHYQVYYWNGLSLVGDFFLENSPRWYGVLPRVDLALDLQMLVEQGKQVLGIKRTWDRPQLEHFAGFYRAEIRGRKFSFVIDSHDGKDLVSPDLQKKCDYYFKANRWRSETYPSNVLPVVNGNGFLRKRHLTTLKNLRDVKKDKDLIFVSRIWGGVEHNVRLFEALASLDCRKTLVAILVKGAGEKENKSTIERLESIGVKWTFDLMPIKQLWHETARSRIVILRAGKYKCIPWRMIDLLGMGACILTDAEFEPEWPEPLRDGVNFKTANISRPIDTGPASPREYNKINDTVSDLLMSEQHMREIKYNNCKYFDEYAVPEAVGNYICQNLANI